MQRISAKGHRGPKCPSVVPFEILHSKGPFEVANFEHFGLERHFNMAAMIVFTPKCPSEGEYPIWNAPYIYIYIQSVIGVVMRIRYSGE